VYDHLKPASRTGAFEEEPLLAGSVPGHPHGRLSNRLHDFGEIPAKSRSPRQDVRPALLSQNDPPTVGIERDRDHPAMVSACTAVRNPLFRTCPLALAKLVVAEDQPIRDELIERGRARFGVLVLPVHHL